MGLKCSHNAFHGSYTAFSRMRAAICEAIGGSWPPHDDEKLDSKKWYHPDDFDRQENEGLILFLNHSDCEGELEPSECKLISRDLRKILDKISEEYDGGHLAAVGGVRAAVEKFADGCDHAAQAGEPLEFW